MESQFYNLAYIMGLTLSYNWKHIFCDQIRAIIFLLRVNSHQKNYTYILYYFGNYE